MANFVSFKKGLLASLPTSYSAGTFYVTTDEKAIYLDVNDSTRIRLGDFQEFATLAELEANTNPSTSALYYVAELNCLAKWDGSKYVQINKDTGATSIEVVGTGNAVTSASYNAATRKITLTMGETFATREYVGEIPTGEAYANVDTIVGYVNKKAEETLAAAQGGSSETAASVKLALDNYKEATDPRIEALEKDTHTHANKAELDKIADGDKAKWDAMEQNAKNYADTKVASVSAGDASVTVGGTSTAPTVAVKLSGDADNAMTLEDDGLKVVIPAAAEYSVVKDETSGDFAAVYHLTKDGVNVGAAINIPKDMVVESGSVVENPEGQTAGTYIKLVLQNVAEPLYINVGSLIEYVTSGSQTGDMIVINISDDHKVTASITDGTITLAKLDVETQTKINKAHDHENKGVIDGITADKVAAWDAAEGNAKQHATDLDTAMNARVVALEAIDHDHANKDELDKIADGDKAKWDEAYDKRHEHSNKVELDKIVEGDKAKWDAAEQNAKTYAEGLMTWGSF